MGIGNLEARLMVEKEITDLPSALWMIKPTQNIKHNLSKYNQAHVQVYVGWIIDELYAMRKLGLDKSVSS